MEEEILRLLEEMASSLAEYGESVEERIRFERIAEEARCLLITARAEPEY